MLQRTFVPDLENPAPPTNAPVHQLDYDRMFRGGVSRSIRRADQRWGLFGHYRPPTEGDEDDELDEESREKLILGVRAVSAPADNVQALSQQELPQQVGSKRVVSMTVTPNPETVKAAAVEKAPPAVEETEVSQESEIVPTGEAVAQAEQAKEEAHKETKPKSAEHKKH